VTGELAAEVVEEQPVAGIAERVAALAAADDDETAAARLHEELDAVGIAVPTERGVPQALRWIVGRVRGQRLVDDLGEAPSSFELLALHVPPGGTGALALERGAAPERQVSISALGAGFGGGRKLTIALNEGIAARTSCMRILQHVTLRVRRFEGGDGQAPLVSTDVAAYGARELQAWPDCPYCGAAEPDPFEYDADSANALDLRGYDADVAREQSITLEGSRKADVGLSLTLPGAGAVSAGFHLEQQTRIACTVSYSFPPGRCFTPYRPRGQAAVLPYWHASADGPAA
jgi:hypothetical protein